MKKILIKVLKIKKNKNNNLLSKKRSLPNKDSFNEQDKNKFV